MALAPFIGIFISPATGFEMAGVLFIVAFGLTGLGFLIAWPMESTQGFHAIMNLFLIPMWLLSGALFPDSGAAGWVKWIMRLNPLTYGVAAVRNVLFGGPNLPFYLLVIILFGATTYAASWYLACRRSTLPA